MKIQFRQSGGFAGLTRGCTIDTSRLSPADASELEKLTRASTHSPGVSDSGADMIQYTIEIDDKGQRRSLLVDDMTLTPELAPLVDFLMQHAKPESPT